MILAACDPGLFAKVHRWYLAGPLFTREERELAEKLANVCLSVGYKAFVPHKMGLLVHKLYKELYKKQSGVDLTEEQCLELANFIIFCLDVYFLRENCQGIIVILNGRVPDEGTIVEATMAWCWGYPVILYKDDPRALMGGQDNPMLTYLANTQFPTLDTVEGLLTELTIFKSKNFASNAVTPVDSYRFQTAPTHCSTILNRSVVDFGRYLFDLRKACKDEAELAEKIYKDNALSKVPGLFKLPGG